MRWVAIVLAGAWLASASAAPPGDESAFVALINDYRAAPRECEGRRLPMAGPLAPVAALADADPGASGDLGRALAGSGYRAAVATTLIYSGLGDAQEALRFAQERHCATLLDPRYSQIGIARARNGWRINLARPLLSPELGDWRQAGQQVLRLVNEARARPRPCGNRTFAAVQPLAWNEALAEAALAHSRDMAEKNYFSHDDPAGHAVGERARHAGYRWRHVGENIAAGMGDAAQAVAGWLASPGHCANIMAPDFVDMGAAYASDPRSTLDVYWTQTFGLR